MRHGRKSNGASGLTARDSYVLTHTPQILSALLRRSNAQHPNDVVDQARQITQAVFDQVNSPRPLPRDIYLLENAPVVLSSLLLRRQSTTPEALVEPTLSIIGRLYDVIHEIDVPAEAMVSTPIDLSSTH